MTLLVTLPALAIGCDGGEGGGDGTPQASPTPTIEEETDIPATATLAPDIRREDLASHPELRSFLDSAGGVVATSRIQYADLTQDGVDEAVAPVSSGGEGGDIAAFVFGYGPDGLAVLLRVVPESGTLRADVIDGELRITEPVFAPGDPLGFPSQLRHQYYAWDGSALVLDREELESNQD